MPFKDELIAAIGTARKEAKQRRRETLPDQEWWQAIRDEEIKPALEDAAGAASDTGIGGKIQNQNGGKSGLALLAGKPELNRHLTFTSVNGGLQVTSSEGGLDDLWTDRGHVTSDSIRAKIRDFLTLIAGDYAEPEFAVMIGRGPSRR
jgi:hypothetical protein